MGAKFGRYLLLVFLDVVGLVAIVLISASLYARSTSPIQSCMSVSDTLHSAARRARGATQSLSETNSGEAQRANAEALIRLYESGELGPRQRFDPPVYLRALFCVKESFAQICCISRARVCMCT